MAVAAVPLPPGGWLDWGGQFENLVESRARLTLVMLPALVRLFAARGSDDGVVPTV